MTAKERPIVFNSPMVGAILTGRKTQTRRVMRHPPTDKLMACYSKLPLKTPEQHAAACIPCEYGGVGDRLWVKETFNADWHDDRTIFKADGGGAKEAGYSKEPKWRPSTFMPRNLSRITLEITGVRVQRLKKISAKDILAEGVVARAHDDQFGHNPVSAIDGCVYLDLMSLWAAGWNAINAKRSPWSFNPWVWAISFRMLK